MGNPKWPPDPPGYQSYSRREPAINFSEHSILRNLPEASFSSILKYAVAELAQMKALSRNNFIHPIRAIDFLQRPGLKGWCICEVLSAAEEPVAMVLQRAL